MNEKTSLSLMPSQNTSGCETDYVTVCTSCDVQPRTVAGFRGTVRYASVNAHKNKVGYSSTYARCWL